jgi:serine phosphatase RsbU (regulator of sigma subunit)/Tfp pilus assembly protein PilF
MLCSYSGIAQVPFPQLSKKIGALESPDLEKKIERIYNIELTNRPKDKLKLQLWKFYVLDSLGVAGQADTLAMNLSEKMREPIFPCQARIYFRLGNLKNDENLFEEGIKLHHKGLKISKKFNDLSTVAAFYRSIGTAYLKLEQNNTAEKHLKESYRIYTSINDSLGMANATISLGNAMKDQGDLKAADKYYKICLDLARELNNKRLIAGNYNNLGNVERRLKNHKKALDYFFKALEMNKISGNQLWESFNYNNIANTYADLQQYDKAIEYLKISNQIKVEIGDSLSLISGYLGLSDAYASIGNYKDAYDLLKLHNSLKDTLRLAEQATLLKDLEAKYESEKQEIEIERLKTAEKLKDEINNGLEMESRKNKNLALLAILAGILLLGGVAILYRSNKAKKKINDLLNSKNEEIASSNIALQGALGELSEKNKEIIDSINYATYIQRATLPNISQHTSDQMRFELFFAPKDIVSGDFYFSYQLDSRSIFGVADCTGHGVPGAMVSLVGMNSLDKVVREEKYQSTSQMVESLNNYVVESLYRGSETLNDGMDISFCHLDHDSNILYFTGANHTAYVIRPNSFFDDNLLTDSLQLKGRTDSFSLLSLNGTRRPIGKTLSTESFGEVRLKLQRGDRIILFSDGYADQIGGNHGKKLKKGALLELILRSAEFAVSDQAEFMRNQFEKWKGHQEQVDDVCMLFVEVKR